MTYTTRPAPSPIGGGYDAYANLSGKGKNSDENEPLQPGEFTARITALSVGKRAQLQVVINLFKELSKILLKSREKLTATDAEVKAHKEVELEKASKTILTALRREEIGKPLVEAITLQLYEASVLADDFEKAINLYPELKNAVAGSMRGIYVLSQGLREKIFKHDMLDNYFLQTPNSREGLLAILLDKSMTTDTPDKQLIASLFHFGTLLPVYFLLASCSDLTGGVCGNCNSTTEERIRLIFGDAFRTIKPGLLNRLCQFASDFA